jgi:CRISPR-associated protein Cmr5
MNKKRVDRWIPPAYDLIDRKIAKEGKVEKGFRGQISSFGAAVQMGSVLSAVAFFTHQGKAKVERGELMNVINELVNPNGDELFNYIRGTSENNLADVQEKILDAAIAVKLALNLFELVEKELDKGGGEDE